MRTQWKKALFYCAALPDEASVLLEDVGHVVQAAPFRHLVTPGGYGMSVAMTNCGRVGWVSDRTPTATTRWIRDTRYSDRFRIWYSCCRQGRHSVLSARRRVLCTLQLLRRHVDRVALLPADVHDDGDIRPGTNT